MTCTNTVFSSVNKTFGLRLGVPGWVAPLVAPAVDLSVLALLIAIRQLSLRGASADVMRPARRLLLVSSFVTLALNVAEPLIAGEIGRALFDAVGPLLLIGWADVGPSLLRELASATPPEEETAAPSASPRPRVPAAPEVLADTRPELIDSSPPLTKRSSLSKLDDDLVERAIEVDRRHREEHRPPRTRRGGGSGPQRPLLACSWVFPDFLGSRHQEMIWMRSRSRMASNSSFGLTAAPSWQANQ